MQKIIENEFMRVAADTKGAELASVYLKKSDREALWQGTEEGYWNRRAPILFPHCGRVKDDALIYEGKTYVSKQHGFLRDMEFSVGECTDTEMSFVFTDNEETQKRYPFHFEAVITYVLQGEKLLHRCKITNRDAEKPMYFSLGYHPAFNCPFSEDKTFEDYSLVFEKKETPHEIIHSLETGYNSGELRQIFENSECWALKEHMFDQDSIAMSDLDSKWVKLEENGTGKGIVFDIEKFPYVVFWSCMAHPVKFLCVEPWYGINAYETDKGEFSQKPGVRSLAGGAAFEAELGITFVEE